MKKLITAAMALAMVASMASAEVVSGNIVGYQTETADGEYRPLTVKFQEPGADGGQFNITNVIDGTTVGIYSDLLLVYDPALGFINYLWDGGAWVDDVDYVPISLDVVPGNGFLMQAATSWTQMGEVASTNTYVHAIPLSTFTFVGNAFPAEQTLGNFDWSDVVVYTDLLLVYDPALGFLNYLWDGSTWVDDVDYIALPNSTLAEGFLFFSDTVESLTQRIAPPYYVDE